MERLFFSFDEMNLFCKSWIENRRPQQVAFTHFPVKTIGNHN
uniref:Uncharacterized protein n=1 Tax=Rhizophora mucronata TaxID=61149 RepID=A0A2P2QEE0_RHIMU